ncbi:30S ribosome-binding factor RbfA [Patescibacteria group bacterium]|nr:30S ribosome-binding factor RbfA [Patescibacteria group bacterium]
MSLRLEKINDQIRDVLTQILHHEYGSSMGIITVTRVKTSPDLHSAKVYISSYQPKDKPENDVIAVINQNQKKIRGQLASLINLKYTPQLKFYPDTTVAEAARIEQLLKKITPQ